MSDGRPAESDGRLREYVVVLLKGMAMGSADSVPGMSGGTIALITGIYERLITALTALDPSVLGHVPRLGSATGRRAFLEDLREMDIFFLAVLGVGAASALVIVSRLAHGAITEYRVATFAFFLGLIAASAIILYREVDPAERIEYAAGVGGLAIAAILSLASGQDLLSHGIVVVALAGFVTLPATVLPGISGASILLLLGQYEYLSGVLKQFVDGTIAFVRGGPSGPMVEAGGTVLAFGVGALVGLLSVAHAIRWALDANRSATLTFLVSLLAGTLLLPLIEIEQGVATWGPTAVASVVVPAVVGIVAVLALDHYTDDLSY